jgi:hypothetical protein
MRRLVVLFGAIVAAAALDASNAELLFDAAGNLTHVYASGVVEHIVLPSGSLFISAGRLDFLAHPGATFLLTPDVGESGDVAAFCAALT